MSCDERVRLFMIAIFIITFYMKVSLFVRLVTPRTIRIVEFVFYLTFWPTEYLFFHIFPTIFFYFIAESGIGTL